MALQDHVLLAGLGGPGCADDVRHEALLSAVRVRRNPAVRPTLDVWPGSRESAGAMPGITPERVPALSNHVHDVTHHTGGHRSPTQSSNTNPGVVVTSPNTHKRRFGRMGLAALAVGSLVMLAACGSDPSPATGSDSSSDDAASKTIAFSPLALKIPAMKGLSEGVTAYGASKGYEVIVQDPNLDPQKQVTDLQSVIESGRVAGAWAISVAAGRADPGRRVRTGQGRPDDPQRHPGRLRPRRPRARASPSRPSTTPLRARPWARSSATASTSASTARPR